MEFEWDPRKARRNEIKHDVSFDEATEVFADIHSSTVKRFVGGTSLSPSQSAVVESA